jgi:serine kinase of HPr protein (carbohydrate metabolism regulator)
VIALDTQLSAAEPRNRHATSLVYDGVGLLIEGASGSGKSALALALMAQAKQTNKCARLIADDQTFLATEANRLIAQCPLSIAGLIEHRGTGILTVPFVSEATIDGLIRLVPLPKFSGEVGIAQSISIKGVSIPMAVAMAKNTDMALEIALTFIQHLTNALRLKI